MQSAKGEMGTMTVGSAITRRGFLGAGALAAAGCALAGPGRLLAEVGAGATDDGTGGIRLGVCSYSFHQFDRAKVIGFMKQLHCERLNVKDAKDHLPMTPASATDEAVAAYKAAGICLTATGVIYFPKAEDADVREKFEYAKRAGVSLIVGSPTHASLPVVEKFAKEYDMRLAIHNHGTEDKEWPSPLDVLKVIEPMDARIGVCIDVGHAVRALGGSGTELVKAIHTCGKRVFDVHMKDLADLNAKDSQVAVGEGKMPVREIFAALKAIGYGGCVDLEYEINENDPLPGMMKSFAFMRGVAKGLANSGQ